MSRNSKLCRVIISEFMNSFVLFLCRRAHRWTGEYAESRNSECVWERGRDSQKLAIEIILLDTQSNLIETIADDCDQAHTQVRLCITINFNINFDVIAWTNKWTTVRMCLACAYKAFVVVVVVVGYGVDNIHFNRRVVFQRDMNCLAYLIRMHCTMPRWMDAVCLFFEALFSFSLSLLTEEAVEIDNKIEYSFIFRRVWQWH